MLFLLQHVLSLLGIAAVALAVGLPITRRLGCAGLLERATWGVTLGLLLFAQALFLLGALGLLRTGWIVVALLVAGLFGGRELWALAGEASTAVANGGRRSWLGCGIGLALAAPFALSALYPPHAWDETLYHLVFARAFAESGSMPFIAHLRVPVFPPLGELLDAGVLVLADDISTHWISWLATLATAGLLAVWPRRDAPSGAGAVAAALHLGTPMVVYLAGVAYVDPLLALWVTAALAAWRKAIDEDSRRWRLVAGACLGSAASVKYLALFFMAWLALEALLLARGTARRRLGDAWELAAAAAATSLPAYLRIVWWTGNPLFPFYPQLFGMSDWAYEAVPAPANSHRVIDALALPWRSVFARASVGEMPPLSPWWLIGLGILLVGAWRVRAWRRVLAMGAAYLLVVPPNARYLLAILPVTALAGVSILFALAGPRALSRRALAAICTALLLPAVAYAGWLCARRGPLPLDRAAREAFLERQVPGYRAVEFLNRALGASYTAYGLEMEPVAYHARGVWLGDWTGPARYDRILPAFTDAAALSERLRSLGADHLVLRRDAPPLPPGAIGSGALRCVYDDGEFRVFELGAR
ncbi:MAG: glycosyltransferase family 39 protein [Acidobacteriota bacterium]